MESLKTKIPTNIKEELQKEYAENLQDVTFNKLVINLKITPEIGAKNTTLLKDSALELKNCENCSSLACCQNKLIGHYLYPKVIGKIIELGYIPCKKNIENQKLIETKNTETKEFLNARFKEIDIQDKKRVQVIKWLKNFYDEYTPVKDMKGLYLHGSFGSGKTYLIYALLNELKINKKVSYAALYFPEFLRDLKEDWNTYSEKINYYANVSILFLDDIGAETVSEWGRDEVLGTILQARMNNHLPTFLTSNLTINELEYHLATAKSTVDNVKARRIIERIKQLTIDMELISENKRK